MLDALQGPVKAYQVQAWWQGHGRQWFPLFLSLLLQPAYVLQIFPPCEFSESHLSRLAPDLLASISNISPHLMIVIASV